VAWLIGLRAGRDRPAARKFPVPGSVGWPTPRVFHLNDPTGSQLRHPV